MKTTGALTGNDNADALFLLQDLVRAEMAHWVPDASQRLIRRAASLLSLPELAAPSEGDHGPNPGDHALVTDWVGGLYVLKCCTCQRLFHA